MSQEQPTPTPASAGERSLPELFGELWGLVKDYVRQETVDPIKGVGRYVAFGVAGAVLVGLGAVFLAVGGLRLIQDEGGSAFEGNLTWIPYFIMFGALLIGAALSLRAATRRRPADRA